MTQLAEKTDLFHMIEELKVIEKQAEELRFKIRTIKKRNVMEKHIHEMMVEICSYMGMTLAEVLSNTRKEKVCIPRHILRYVLRMNGLSLTTIAEHTATAGQSANHATIINSVDVVAGALEVNCVKFTAYFKQVSHLIDYQAVKSKKVTFDKTFAN